MWQFSWNSEKKVFDPFYKTFLTNRDENEDEDKKIWKNEFDFWILHIKTRLFKNFHENLRKFLTHSLSHFWLIEAKMKMKIKKFGKMSLIFDLSVSKLGYMAIFIRICLKNFHPFFRTFLTIWGKNEDKDKKIWENVLNFWILHIKISICDNFHENWRKKVFFEITWKGHTRTEVTKGLSW